jgi:type II secretory ATPase GspE/PulE/Tfp pilus assembly ATPase PilB-like protein
VRTLCPDCKKPGALTPEDAAALGPAAGQLADQAVWLPAGCPACLGGYRGRTGLYEFMLIDPALQEAVRARAGDRGLRELARHAGMRTLLEDGVHKILDGHTSVAEVLRAVGRAGGDAAG